MYEPAVRGIVGNFRDVTERRRTEALGARETDVLERILAGTPVPQTLHQLLEAVEEYLGDVSATIRLFDAETGEVAARRRRRRSSPAFIDAIDDRLAAQVGDAEEAYNARFEPIIIPDIANDFRFPHIQQLRELTRREGFRAFWSVPIRTPTTRGCWECSRSTCEPRVSRPTPSER